MSSLVRSAPFAVSSRVALAPRRDAVPSRAGADRKTLGILAILGSTACFPLSDLAAQSLMGTLPPMEVAWLRYAVFFLAVLPLLLRSGVALSSARPGLQILRGLMNAGATIAALVAFKYLPVPETTAIGFVCPVFVTALAMLVLSEKVGARRWAAAAVALAGVFVVVQPGTESFRPIALLPLLGAAAGAVAVICTRLNKGDDPRTTILYTASVGALVLTFAAASDMRVPTMAQLPVVLVVGLCGGAGSVLQVVGYRLAPASLLAPFTYMQIIVASGLSFALLGAVPPLATIGGTGLIAASTIYTAYRERVRGIA